MKKVEQFVFYVDGHRRPSRQRNTKGRYRVAAKTPKEAEKLLREKIRFGSIQYFGTADVCDDSEWNLPSLPYKSVAKYAGFDSEKLWFKIL